MSSVPVPCTGLPTVIQVPDELRDVDAGEPVNLFVSVGQATHRLKGEVHTIRERGTSDEVLEVRATEQTPGTTEFVFWLGTSENGTYLLPMDSSDDGLVYAEYRRARGRTGLYVDSVKEVRVGQSSSEATGTVEEPTQRPENSD